MLSHHWMIVVLHLVVPYAMYELQVERHLAVLPRWFHDVDQAVAIDPYQAVLTCPIASEIVHLEEAIELQTAQLHRKVLAVTTTTTSSSASRPETWQIR
jgi:hypothetical protein